MSRRVQEKDIELMIKLYAEIGTYAGVARETGWSASTVSRYIKENSKPKRKVKISKREFVIKEKVDLTIPDDWSNFLKLSKGEVEGITELQKTIGGM